MPRRARLAVAGIPWHIIQLGNNRSVCFYTEADYQYYLEILAAQADKHGCQIHAYCLMTNHVHLLVTPERTDSASLMMKHLGQRYVQYINRSYRRSGTLWEGRFRSSLTQDEDYILTCYGYIELNPVRVAMVAHSGEYRWSSYAVNGQGLRNPVITPHAQYLSLADSWSARHKACRALFGSHMESSLIDEIRHATNGNYVLGNSRFKEEIALMLERRVSPLKAGRPVKES